ncbi:hypothetical protein HMPREF9072_00202 [Capnocytophaga sp. oral taxon 324 str. F0483]|nr:hypothetical protein HMPREF9072_00202 [Capnocytophaga sp. oral taxon 324 str. F0483]
MGNIYLISTFTKLVPIFLISKLDVSCTGSCGIMGSANYAGN